MPLTQELEEAEEVTRKLIVRHHFLIWAETQETRMNLSQPAQSAPENAINVVLLLENTDLI